MTTPDYFLIKLKADESVDVKARWKAQPEWIALQAQIRAALSSGEELPDGLPMLEAEFGDGVIKLADLRGIDLSNLSIGSVDLAYCCFDGADFSGTWFNDTFLQYSSMANANFERSNWKMVQASPISAPDAIFGNVFFMDSFLMRSDFANAGLTGASFFHTALAGSNMVGVKLSRTTMRSVDITSVLLLRRDWAKFQGQSDVIG